MKILHTSDIHLREFEDKRWQTLIKLLEIGEKEEIKVFVISGDLFDNNININQLRPKLMKYFSNSNFDIVIIPGNHDKDSYKNAFLGQNTKILLNILEPYEKDNVCFWGLPFEEIDEIGITERLNQIKTKLASNKVNILLYHGEIVDKYYSRLDFGEEPEYRYMPMKLDYFEDFNFDYILAGHFHRNFDIFHLKNGCFFVYPGSPISITRRETGRRKVNIFNIDESPHEFLLDSFHFEIVNIDLNPFTDNPIDEIVMDSLKNLHPSAFVDINVRGFINSSEINLTEPEIIGRLERLISKSKYNGMIIPEFQDISNILNNTLYKRIEKKISNLEESEENKNEIRRLIINSMMGVGI